MIWTTSLIYSNNDQHSCAYIVDLFLMSPPQSITIVLTEVGSFFLLIIVHILTFTVVHIVVTGNKNRVNYYCVD